MGNRTQSVHVQYWVRFRKGLLGILVTVLCAAPAAAQHLVDPEAPEIEPSVRVLEDVIASGRGAKDNTLACRLDPRQPVMNFSFRYQAGYTVVFPMRQFPPAVVEVLDITRVTSRDNGEHFYFVQRSAVPAAPRSRNLYAELGGGFFVGEGRYDVDTMVLDQAGRRCYKHWGFKLNLNNSEREMAQLIETNTVEPLVLAWRDTSQRERPYGVTVFLHLAPFSPRSVTMNLFDETMLITTLRSLFDATPFHETGVRAISLHQQRELLHVPELDRNTFYELSTTMENLEVGTVELSALANPRGYIDMLRDMVNEELASETPPDAIVFIGSSSRYTLNFPRDLIEPADGGSTKFFYFQLSRFQLRRYRTNDSLAKLTRRMGGEIFQISNPKQFANAIHKMEEMLAARDPG